MAVEGWLIFFGLAISAVIVFFWASQLLDLMRQKDDAFPGRWDKPIWVAIILFVPLVGAIIYALRIPSPPLPHAPTPLELEWQKIQAQRAKSPPETGEAT